MKTGIRAKVLLLLCLTALFVLANISISGKQEQPPCSSHPKLLRNARGEPIWISSDGLKKRATHRVAPQLPSSVRAQGTIIVSVLVDTEGRVQCAKATKGHPLLRRAAEEAAKQWTFEPMEANGKPVAVFGCLIFDFAT
jgi:TonB family protein